MLSPDQKKTYVGMFVLKMLDLDPRDGGKEFPVNLPHDLAPFEPVLEYLAIDGMVEVHRRSGKYRLTDRGAQYLATLIEEAETYIEEFDEMEVEPMLSVLERRRIDPLRVRFLWGWYQGEFDDPVMFQQRRGVSTVERDWATYLGSDAFFDELARDLEPL